MTKEPLWRPDPARIEQSHMHRFMHNYGRAAGCRTYDELHRWSIEEPGDFWSAVWDFSGIRAASKGRRDVIDVDRMPGAQWFPDARLNFAENLLLGRNIGTESGIESGDQTAIIFRNERGARRTISWDELRASVAGVVTALREAGVTRGDTVAGLLPNMPEAIIAMLATTSIGAIWTSCSPDFGHAGVLDRFGQIQPKVLFAVDGYFYAGKRIDCVDTLTQLCSDLESVRSLIVVNYIGEPVVINSAIEVREFPEPDTQTEIVFEQLPFNHPLYVLYTSGTTGPPKSIIHSAGGTLLQHRKEHLLHTDIHQNDRVFYYTTCGWMMWHWLVSTLASGATVVLYDGAPFFPDARALWKLADEEALSVFGTSAKYINALEKDGVQPMQDFSLTKLRTILSTGSPLSRSGFEYIYRSVKHDVQLASITGGTDIISCFALGNPTLPVYAGEIQSLGLGMDVRIFDDTGNEVVGVEGELVCTTPFPSMPLGFWGDPDGSRYHAAYFERFKNTWWHGDYAERTEHGGIVMHGRSDSVLNPGGVRIGTAEIYRLVDTLPEIAESIVVGQQWDDDVRIVLFVKTQTGISLDETLSKKIRLTLRTQASPRHVPSIILEVPEIPRTISGKIVESTVRDVIHGRKVRNINALANPDSLAAFRDRNELKS